MCASCLNVCRCQAAAGRQAAPPLSKFKPNFQTTSKVMTGAKILNSVSGLLATVGMLHVLVACGSGYSTEPSVPRDINYRSRGSTYSPEPTEYVVRCSNGNKLIITAWHRRTKWCVGNSVICTSDQLKTAKLVCRHNYKFALQQFYRRGDIQRKLKNHGFK